MIRIAERYRPFSHRVGTVAMIPKTSWQVRAFPTRLEVFKEGRVAVTLDLELTGPVWDFTVMLDLEKGGLLIFGTAKQGYYQLYLAKGDKEEVFCELCRGEMIAYQKNGEHGKLKRGDRVILALEETFFEKSFLERLSFGVTKKLDVDLVWRRFSLEEILPVLFRLGQIGPQMAPQQVLESQDKVANLLSLEELEKILQQNFSSLFAPDINGQKHLGLEGMDLKAIGKSSKLPCAIYESIRSFLVKDEGDEISLLPRLPKQFRAGRVIDLDLSQITLSIEWTKGKLRKVFLQSKEEGSFSFILPGNLKSFRFRERLRDRGKEKHSRQPIFLKKEGRYILDKFMQ